MQRCDQWLAMTPECKFLVIINVWFGLNSANGQILSLNQNENENSSADWSVWIYTAKQSKQKQN